MKASAFSTDTLLGNVTTYCYQEFANVSTACGGFDNGTYNISSSWNDEGKDIIDGDWNTWDYDYDTNNPATVLINYSKPVGALSTSLWEVSDDAGLVPNQIANLTIDSNCWNAYSGVLSFQLTSNFGGRSRAMWQCWNGTGWTLLRNQSTSKAYEEAMVWAISSGGNLSSENMTFTGNQNITRYLNIPSGIFLTNAQLNIAGYNATPVSTCYQEYANVSTICGGLNTGKYSCVGVWGAVHNCSATIDGDYTSYGYGNDASNSTLYINYTKPTNSGSTSFWQVKDATSLVNLTINTSCWNYNSTTVIFKVISYNTGSDVEWDCYNGTWSTMKRSLASGNIFEESMIWNVPGNYTTNPYLSINGIQVWNYSGIFNGINTTNNFPAVINNYLSTCSYNYGYCTIPFIFHSDTTGILGYSNLIFNNLGFTENSQTYNATVYETSLQSFKLNITYDSNLYINSNIKFIYNGTSYTPTVTSDGVNQIASYNLYVPIVLNPTNITFYWDVALTNSTSTTHFNSTFNNQTINTFALVKCNATYTTVTLNFTLKEEATFNLLNGSIAMNLNYKIGNSNTSVPFSYSDQNDNNTNFAFCISPASINLTATGTVQYSKLGYDPRTYFFNNAVLDNVSQNISLYLANTTTTDPFTFVVVDQYNQPVAGAYVYVQRWDIGTNNFYTIGILQTNSNGQALINLRLADAYYRELVFYNGILYLTTTPSLESTTTTPKTLVIQTTLSNPYLQFDNIPYTFTFDNTTNIFQFVYADPTGVVQTGCLRVYSIDSWNGSVNIYSSCVQSTSGTLLYQITQNGSYVGVASFILNSNYNSVEQDVKSIPVTVGGNTARNTFKTYGFVAALLLIGTLGLIGVAAGNIPLAGFLIIAGSVVSNLIGLVSIPIAVMYGLVGLILVVVVLAAVRRYG